jgi:SSS family solute:Na+ symporter
VINTASSAVGPREGKIGIITGNLIAIPVVAMAALCGIVSRYVFPGIPSLAALPALLEVVPPWVGVFFLLAMWAPLMSAASPFLMGATTIVVKGFIAPVLTGTNDRRLLFFSRMTTMGIGALSLFLGFFVREILREITFVAVPVGGIVYIVFFGWFVKKIPSVWAFTALAGSLAILFLSLVLGYHKLTHPIWPATAYVMIVMFAGLFVSGKGRRDAVLRQ